ncbi:endonuclease/exonuclease/phosphatase family protein [Primorskyibacter flagellatus]|uniref:endonuclease/exonuclease/phosphatase family protein n=1 Tax=Primorskyibacter flagellatus TaxID=1387277 RepID=UPI003A94B643
MKMLRGILKWLMVVLFAAIVAVAFQLYRNSGDKALPNAPLEGLRIATYNVHYIVMGQETGPWSRGDWDRRRGPLDLAFKEMDADVVAFQEMESFTRGGVSRDNLALDWLLERNPAFAAAAIGDPVEFPSTQPIFYKTERLEMLEQGWFFFSDTPDTIYSRTFNGSYPAYASWARFRERRSQTEFRVVNVHTDYGSRSNRLRSIDLVAARVASWLAAKETVMVVGDLNARRGDRGVKILENAGFTFAPVEGATYHFNRGINLFGAIDHVAWAGDLVLARPPVVLRHRFDGEWPTDHYPVVVDFLLPQRPRQEAE